MSDNTYYTLEYGRIERTDDLYYIYNDDEEYPIVLRPKQMLRLVRSIGKMQILGKQIHKRLQKENNTSYTTVEVGKTHYGLTVAWKKLTLVRLLVISLGTEVALSLGEYYISHKNHSNLNLVHGKLQINLDETYSSLLLFINIMLTNNPHV